MPESDNCESQVVSKCLLSFLTIIIIIKAKWLDTPSRLHNVYININWVKGFGGYWHCHTQCTSCYHWKACDIAIVTVTNPILMLLCLSATPGSTVNGGQCDWHAESHLLTHRGTPWDSSGLGGKQHPMVMDKAPNTYWTHRAPNPFISFVES